MAELIFRRRARTRLALRLNQNNNRLSAAERLGAGCLDRPSGGPAKPERELFRPPRPRPRPLRSDCEETVARSQPVAHRHARTVRRRDRVFRGTRGDVRPDASDLCHYARHAAWFFRTYFAGEAHANLRFPHHPQQDAAEDSSFGQGPHTDNSFMKGLARTEVPGLAVRLPSGEWFAPSVIPGAFLINLGNIVRRWSSDRSLLTPRGVLNDSGTERYSIAYFHGPNPDRVIECLSSRTSPKTRRAIRRRSVAISSPNSIGRIISTRKATAPRRRRKAAE